MVTHLKLNKKTHIFLNLRIKSHILRLKKDFSVVPGLAVILITGHKMTEKYAYYKQQIGEELGFYFVLKKIPPAVTSLELKQTIEALNKNPEIHGINLQLPLPSHLKEDDVISWIDPKKDPYSMTLENKSLLWSGSPRIVPCLALGIIALLRQFKIPIKGKNAVVVGRSQLAGLPVAQQLLFHNATVTVCHSHTKNLRKITSQGDITVVCAGSKGLLGWEDFKKGSVVLDTGVHHTKKGSNIDFEGDVRIKYLRHYLSNFFSSQDIAPITVTMLLKNTCDLFSVSKKYNFFLKI